jgi:hypothetical protein
MSVDPGDAPTKWKKTRSLKLGSLDRGEGVVDPLSLALALALSREIEPSGTVGSGAIRGIGIGIAAG